jgi:hypothetical protein
MIFWCNWVIIRCDLIIWARVYDYPTRRDERFMRLYDYLTRLDDYLVRLDDYPMRLDYSARV